jgi:hypothetical protein
MSAHGHHGLFLDLDRGFKGQLSFSVGRESLFEAGETGCFPNFQQRARLFSQRGRQYR